VLIPNKQDIVFKDTSQLGDDGWMYDMSTNTLLFWVPLHARQGLLRPSNVNILGTAPIQLDFSTFKPWEQW
jgi:hypothetical protein